MDVSGLDDMLLDESSMEGSSQESLTGRFEDLFASHNKGFLPIVDPLPSADESLAISEVPSPHNPVSSKLDSTSTILPKSSERASQVTKDRYYVITKIESIFEGVVDALLDYEERMILSMCSRKNLSRSGSRNDMHDPESKLDGSKEISFPGRTAQEAWRFTVVFRILEMVHDALVNNILITKRDIYYHDPNLFTKQEIVDRYVDDIAYTFEVPRSLLNVRATAKGLVAGRFELHKRDGSIIAGSTEKEGYLVPHPKDISHACVEAAEWILVVEKEATFCSIVNSHPGQSLLSKGIIITGKGYPDIATRAFLRALVVPSTWNLFSSPKSYALVDYDPDGLAILSTYKHGSRALPHENMDIAIGTIEWLGLNSSQAIADREVVDYQQGLVTLSDRDRRRANQLLDDAPFREAGPERAWRRELQVMLVLNMKAEMQICDSDVKGLSRWLEVHLS
ncbi:DNA topoisomerase IV, alpha subunit [Viridothelium virens]|uniref:DNA topoisomerase (ATP-hydrolyzing) n=1 Tax=Viridothelium virens TaxID=1048519 RepID=A0A6A6GWQ6_VIRVR|nr:DNA topoisomerase IV, alpha subunit [Viridothelium virens]